MLVNTTQVEEVVRARARRRLLELMETDRMAAEADGGFNGGMSGRSGAAGGVAREELVLQEGLGALVAELDDYADDGGGGGGGAPQRSEQPHTPHGGGAGHTGHHHTASGGGGGAAGGGAAVSRPRSIRAWASGKKRNAPLKMPMENFPPDDPDENAGYHGGEEDLQKKHRRSSGRSSGAGSFRGGGSSRGSGRRSKGGNSGAASVAYVSAPSAGLRAETERESWATTAAVVVGRPTTGTEESAVPSDREAAGALPARREGAAGAEASSDAWAGGNRRPAALEEENASLRNGAAAAPPPGFNIAMATSD